MLGLSRSYATLSTHARSASVPIATYDFTQGSLPAGVFFSRASRAMYFGAGGIKIPAPIDTPRFETEPSFSTPAGLLLEDQATNLLRWNDDFSQSVWVVSAFSSTSTTISAPDGQAVTGWALGDGYIFQDISSTSGAAYTTSVWLKANQSCTLGFRVLATSGTASVPISVDTGWQRYTVSGTASGATSRFLVDGRSIYSYGASGLEVFMWQPQIEAGSSQTSEISTLGSTVTRAADQIGLQDHNGVFDVEVTTSAGVSYLTNQPLSAGWWPSVSNTHIKKLRIFASSTF